MIYFCVKYVISCKIRANKTTTLTQKIRLNASLLR